MSSELFDVSAQIRWINLAKRCHEGDGGQIRESVSRHEGVNMLGKVTEEGIELSRGRSGVESFISSHDRDDAGVLGWSEGKGRMSKTGEVVSIDWKVTTCGDSNEKGNRTRGPGELRRDLSSIAQELLELRLNMIKEEERFRRQEQNLLLKEGLRYKSQMKGVQPEVRTEHEKSKSQREQRRKQRSPLRNQTNLIIDDLKRKVEQARLEKARIMKKIASITS
ncbi:hypothetical protein R1sor_016445 [Riccia sorocarpa]|uniref:Uncharacterized protein n=1 Tax=Riccia sorocarpa TaxID=122646 RepID=A0ABD3HGW0_9MARC